MIITRRSFFGGLAASLAAPAIVRAANLMPVRGVVMQVHYTTGTEILARCRNDVLTMEHFKRCKALLIQMDLARKEIERACGVPEGYRLLFVNAAPTAPARLRRA